MENRQGQKIQDIKVGTEVACEWQSGLTEPPRSERQNLGPFLASLPFFSQSRFIPPRVILNSFLLAGHTAEGMNGTCSWTPFKLSPETFKELLQGDEPEAGFSSPEPPEWVEIFSDWYIWLMETRHEIPAMEHKRLKDNLIHLERLAKLPKGTVDRRKLVDYKIREVEARTQLHEFLAKQIERIGRQTANSS